LANRQPKSVNHLHLSTQLFGRESQMVLNQGFELPQISGLANKKGVVFQGKETNPDNGL